MKKLFLLLFLFPFFASAQTTPAQDTTLISPSTSVAPQWRYSTVNGYLTLQAFVNGKYYYYPHNKALRGYYGQLSANNNWSGNNNSTGYWAGTQFISTSYANAGIAGDHLGGQFKVGNIDNTIFGGLWTYANNTPEWRIGRLPGGSFGWQRWNGSTWVNSVVTSSDGLSTTINGSPILTNANSYNKTQQDSIYQRLVNRYDTQSNIAGDKIYTGSGVYSTDGGATGTTLNNTGVSTNGASGFVFNNPSITAQVNGNAIYTLNKNTGYATSLRPERVSFNIGDNQLSLSATPTTNNRSQLFQDKNGTIALLSDITGAGGATYSKAYIDSADATKENLSNKSNTLTNSTTQYPTTQAVTNALSNKQNTGNYITDLTGEVTATGPGSATATINRSIQAVWNGRHAFVDRTSLNTALGATWPAALYVGTTAFNTSGAYTLQGFGIRQDPLTYTSSAASSTMAQATINGYGQATIANANATTITKMYGNFFRNTIAGANTTITNNYAAGFSGDVEVAGNSFVTGNSSVSGTQTNSGSVNINAGMTISSNVFFGTNNTYSIGTATNNANTVNTRNINGNGSVAINANSGTSPIVLNGSNVMVNNLSASQLVSTDANKNLTSTNLVAGAGININNTAGAITISAAPNVVEITGTTQTATGNTIYIPHNSSLTTITVPATTTIGTLYQVIGEGAGGWRLALPSGYTAVGVGSFTTTAGGSLNSTDRNCTITIRLTNTNKFTVTTSQGTINPL